MVNYRMFGRRGPYLNAYSMPGFQSSGLARGLPPMERGFVNRTGGTPAPGQPSAPNPPLAANQPNPSWAQRTFGGMREWAQNNRGSVGMLLGGLAKAVTARGSTYASSLYSPVQHKPNAAQQVAQMGYNVGANRAASDYLQGGDPRHLQFMDPQMAQGLRSERTSTAIAHRKAEQDDRSLDIREGDAESKATHRIAQLQADYDRMSLDADMKEGDWQFKLRRDRILHGMSKELEGIKNGYKDGQIRVKHLLDAQLRKELQSNTLAQGLYVALKRDQLQLAHLVAGNQKHAETAAAKVKESMLDAMMETERMIAEWGWDKTDGDKAKALRESTLRSLNNGHASDRIKFRDEHGQSVIPSVAIGEDGTLGFGTLRHRSAPRPAPPVWSGMDLAAAFGAIAPNAAEQGGAAASEAEGKYPGGVDPATGEKLQIGRQYQSEEDGTISVLTADGWR